MTRLALAAAVVVKTDLAMGLPLGDELDHNQPIWFAGRVIEDENRARLRHVSPGFFETVGAPLVEGRTLLPFDVADQPGAVVSKKGVAKACWPGGDPLALGLTTCRAVGSRREQPSQPAVYPSFRQGPVRRMAAGLFGGTITALALGEVVSFLLFGVSPRDPSAFAGVFLVLITVGILASFIPARRATRVSPDTATRRIEPGLDDSVGCQKTHLRFRFWCTECFAQ